MKSELPADLIRPEPITRPASEVEIGDVIFDDQHHKWRKVQFVETVSLLDRRIKLHFTEEDGRKFHEYSIVIVGFRRPEEQDTPGAEVRP